MKKVYVPFSLASIGPLSTNLQENAAVEVGLAMGCATIWVVGCRVVAQLQSSCKIEHEASSPPWVCHSGLLSSLQLRKVSAHLQAGLSPENAKGGCKTYFSPRGCISYCKFSEGTITRVSCKPDFRAEKKGPLWRFSACFSTFQAKKDPKKKSAPNPGYR